VKRFHDVAARYWEEGWRLEPEQFVDRGDEVLLLARLYVRSLRGGPEIGHSFGVLHTVRDGKIVRVRWFSGPQGAFDAMGLRE
jgi:ketosteroid isomerase-like protein